MSDLSWRDERNTLRYPRASTGARFAAVSPAPARSSIPKAQGSSGTPRSVVAEGVIALSRTA